MQNIEYWEKRKKEFKTDYKGRICCISKNTGKLDFVGTIKEIAEFLSITTTKVCEHINEGTDHNCYRIIPQIEGITHKNGIYMGG